MSQYSVNKKSKKAFLRWSAKGDDDFQLIAAYAVNLLVPVMEKAGFKWVETSPDGFKTSHFMIDMERRTESGIECVTYNFDKYRKYKFSITCTVSESSSPFKRNVISRLVKYKSELDKASWWGASKLSLNKEKSFKKEVDKVATLLPQILNFLSNGEIGPNIYKF